MSIIGKYYRLSYVGEDTSLYYVDHKRSSNSMLPQNWNLIVQLWWLAIIMKNRALTKKKTIKNSKYGKLRKNASLTLTIISTRPMWIVRVSIHPLCMISSFQLTDFYFQVSTCAPVCASFSSTFKGKKNT
jgi:hypothetical protein